MFSGWDMAQSFGLGAATCFLIFTVSYISSDAYEQRRKCQESLPRNVACKYIAVPDIEDNNGIQ